MVDVKLKTLSLGELVFADRGSIELAVLPRAGECVAVDGSLFAVEVVVHQAGAVELFCLDCGILADDLEEHLVQEHSGAAEPARARPAKKDDCEDDDAPIGAEKGTTNGARSYRRKRGES